MREHKFRAWSKKKKKMFLPESICRIHFNDGLPFAIYTWDGEMILHDDLVLMLYTGLKDNKGKEIYEGDIILADWHWVEPHVVEYPDDYYDYVEYAIGEGEMRILGNIHENPGLWRTK